MPKFTKFLAEEGGRQALLQAARKDSVDQVKHHRDMVDHHRDLNQKETDPVRKQHHADMMAHHDVQAMKHEREIVKANKVLGKKKLNEDVHSAKKNNELAQHVMKAAHKLRDAGHTEDARDHETAAMRIRAGDHHKFKQHMDQIDTAGHHEINHTLNQHEHGKDWIKHHHLHPLDEGYTGMSSADRANAHTVHKVLKGGESVSPAYGEQIKRKHNELLKKHGKDWRVKAGINESEVSGRVKASKPTKEMHEFVQHHLYNTDHTNDHIKKAFKKKFGDHTVHHYDHIVSKEID